MVNLAARFLEAGYLMANGNEPVTNADYARTICIIHLLLS
jgi:hypothetical protein